MGLLPHRKSWRIRLQAPVFGDQRTLLGDRSCQDDPVCGVAGKGRTQLPSGDCDLARNRNRRDTRCFGQCAANPSVDVPVQLYLPESLR